MSTAQQIEEAIRALEKTERDKLLQRLPQLFLELASDLEWESKLFSPSAPMSARATSRLGQPELA